MSSLTCDEEFDAVLHEGSAQGQNKVLIAVGKGVQHLIAGALSGPIIAFQLQTRIEGIGPGSECLADNPGIGATEFCVIAASLNLSLFQRFRNNVDAIVTCHDVPGVGALHHETNLIRSTATDVDLTILLGDARLQRINRRGSTNGKLLKGFGRSDTNCIGRTLVNQRPFGDNFNLRNFNRLGRHFKIKRRCQVDVDIDVGNGYIAVTNKGSPNRINTGGNVENIILSVHVRRRT